MTDASKKIVARLRKITLALPGAIEKETWGHPTFRIGEKIFCTFGGYDDDPNITVKVGKPALGIFLEDARFYQAAYIGHNGWVSLRANTKLDWDEIEELVKGSYALVAPRTARVPLTTGSTRGGDRKPVPAPSRKGGDSQQRKPPKHGSKNPSR
jgi:predicted DNA-binding protein (MmcQ/YjbR family)